ncbi:ATP-binding protein [Kineococcus sp. NUM-3379]
MTSTTLPVAAGDAPAEGIRRHLRLEGVTTAAGRARRTVREALTAAGREDWADAAELAVSELVTNAALHAHTDVEVTVTTWPDRARVEVRDYSTVLPQQRAYGAQATTGRGMSLVAALTSGCGVTPLPDGKVVWFELPGAEPSEDELLASFGGEWDLDELAGDAGTAGAGGPSELHEVRLSEIPASLWLAARQHHDALLRELALYAARHPGTAVDLATADRARQAFSDPVVAAVERAQREGTTTSPLPAGHPGALPGVPRSLELVLLLGAEVGKAAAVLQDALDTAERLAAAGELLAFPGQPEVVAVRDWLCEQVQSQLAGVAPRPWAGAAQPRFERAAAREHATDAELAPALAEALASGRGVVAADEGNRILAVSAPLAAALGWTVEDLTGRRLVALIPPALREAHVAGFSRHLSTGEAHVLGVPLTLPVLHADGSEVPCSFVIERRPAPAGRSLYLAWIEPVTGGTDEAHAGS